MIEILSLHCGDNGEGEVRIEPNQYSRTALLTTLVRAHHNSEPGPRILNDPYARLMMSEFDRQAAIQGLVIALPDSDRQRLGASFSEAEAMRLCLQALPFAAATLARNRYAEDRLLQAVDAEICQYVLLGAGMDTFAFRQQEVQDRVQIFEVDHPASQSLKKERLTRLGLTLPENLHFVPIDFECEDLAQSLSRSAFAVDKPAFFAWLGVTPYLRSETISRTLQDMSNFASPGSQVVFDFIDLPGLNPLTTSRRIQHFMELLSRLGEPFLGSLDAYTIGSQLKSLGFHIVEHLSPEDQRGRYFLNRCDGLAPTEYYHFICAIVQDSTRHS